MSSWRRRHRPGHRSARSHWPLLGLTAGGGVAAIAAIALVVGIGQVSGSPAGAAVLSAAAGAGAGPQTATYYATRGMGNCSYPSPPAGGGARGGRAGVGVCVGRGACVPWVAGSPCARGLVAFRFVLVSGFSSWR